MQMNSKKQIAAVAISNNYLPNKANTLCELIDWQPTAYDINKVVRKLREQEKSLLIARERAIDTVMEEPFRNMGEWMEGAIRS